MTTTRFPALLLSWLFLQSLCHGFSFLTTTSTTKNHHPHFRRRPEQHPVSESFSTITSSRRIRSSTRLLQSNLFRPSESSSSSADDEEESSGPPQSVDDEVKVVPTTKNSKTDDELKSKPAAEEDEAVEEIIMDPTLGAWVPIGSVSSLEGLDPVPVEVFGTQLVVWKKKKGDDDEDSWSVLLDECPHRMAPLSQGRIDPKSNCIECPYHGWQFDNEGTLTRLPQLEQDKVLPNANARSYPTKVHGDLLFAFLPTRLHGESFPQNDTVPIDYYEDLKELLLDRNQTFYTRELPYSWDFLVENLLDGPAHLPFAHHSYGSRRDDAATVPMKTLVSNFTHYVYQSAYIRNGAERYRQFGFQRPFLAYQDTERGPNNGEWKKTLLFFCVPVREGRSRVITNFDTVVRTKDPNAPDWKVHLFNNQFFDSDVWVHETEINVRSKEEEDPQAVPKYLYPTSSDVSVQGFRKWWTQFGYNKAPRNSFGPASIQNLKRLSRKEQTDPWQGHTQKCSKCRLILIKAKKYQRISLFASSISAIYMLNRSNPFLASAFIIAGILVRERADKMIRALEGEHSPSDVSDRTFAS